MRQESIGIRRLRNGAKYSKMNALAAKPEAPSAPVGRAGSDVRQVRIDEAHAGQRLDNFLLGQLKGVPKSHVYRIVRSGEVRVDRGRVAPDHRLSIGEVVRIPPVRVAAPAAGPAPAPAQEFPVLMEDDALLAIDKPGGIAVHGGSGVAFGVIEQLRSARPQARLLELVHRIDRETSGVLLIAKKRSALTAMHERMRCGQVRKRYLALVRGDWDGPPRALRFPLHKFTTAEGERRVVVRDGGQAAGTRVRALKRLRHPRFGAVTLVQADLETGRTHQIRVHLAYVGLPLLGDAKYGDFELNRALDRDGHGRMFLHAHRMAFSHPADGSEVRLEAPVPEAFERFMAACDETI
jgi:23S rRNA pseudouridine955/2504/2580 synthase